MPHEPALRASLRGRYLKGLEIGDVVQESYERLAKAEGLQHVRNAKSCAFRTAGSVIADHLRRMKTICIISGANPWVIPDRPNVRFAPKRTFGKFG